MNFQVKDITSKFADRRRRTKPSDLKVGDYVLVTQDQRNKLTATFSETPYTVTERNNSQVTSTNKQGHTVTRNVSHYNRITMPRAHDNDDTHYETGLTRNSNDNHKDQDLTDEQNQPLRQSSRVRKEPLRFGSPLPSDLIRKRTLKQ